MDKGAVIGLLGTCLAACATSVTFTPTGPPQAARKPTCEVQLLTVSPATPFVELGVMDVHPGGEPYWDLAAFRATIQPEVCRVGGDAAIARLVDGVYSKATVLKLGTGPVGQDSAAGCQYDTQCKGDRLCVDGRCANPSPR
jgi:hypothetical protein